MQHDHDFNPMSDEERLAAEREAELARRIRREVRRVQRGDADEEMQREEEDEAEERRREAEERAARERRSRNPLVGLVTGNILRQEWLTGHYRYPLLIASVFLLSIIVMFWSLRLDMRCSRVSDEVQLLRERSVRLREECSRRSSHSAVVEELRRRGIPLEDPRTPQEIFQE